MYYLKSLTWTLMLIWLLPLWGAYGQERKIKPGDVIEIVVYENERLNQTIVVGPGGMVDSPLLKEIPIDDITLERFQEILVTQLSRYTERSPLVRVRFVESYAIKVTVLGQVAKPGVYTIQSAATLQGAIGEAGGITTGAQLSQVKLIRSEHAEASAPVMNNGASTQVVNMEKFYLEGNPSHLPMLKDGDTIVVPGDPLITSVKVVGSVQKPGSYGVPLRASVWDVIYLAGGPTEEANLNAVKVISRTGQGLREQRLNIKELAKTKNAEEILSVFPGDVVYVPQKGLTWKKFVSVARDVTTFATLYIIIRYGRRYY